eukprot:55079_1
MYSTARSNCSSCARNTAIQSARCHIHIVSFICSYIFLRLMQRSLTSHYHIVLLLVPYLHFFFLTSVQIGNSNTAATTKIQLMILYYWQLTNIWDQMERHFQTLNTALFKVLFFQWNGI